MLWASGAGRHHPGDNAEPAIVPIASYKLLRKQVRAGRTELCCFKYDPSYEDMKGGEMARTAICSASEGRVKTAPLALVISLSFVLLCPAPGFSASWESVGPSGGYFLGSVTNPADASQITAVTNGPSNVYRSIDGGASWSKIGEIDTAPYVLNDLSAFDFSKLFAITGTGCYRSTDGGVNWFYAPFPYSGYAYRVCVDPVDSSKVYAVGINYNSYDRKYNMAFLKGTDGGKYWTARQFFQFDYFYPLDMAISRSDPSSIYVAGISEVVSGSFYYYYGVLLKSSDGGDNWEDISSSVETEPYQYFCSVAVDPTNAENVCVGGISYFYRPVRTGRNRVLSWERIPMSGPVYSIGIDPVEPSRIYAAGYQSVGVSTDYGQSWTLHDNGIGGAGTHVEVAPADHSTVYISTDNGLSKSSDSGDSWDFAHEGIHAAKITALAVAPSQPATVLLEYDGVGLMGSYDSGGNWDYLGYFVGCGNVCDILVNPLNQNAVLALEGAG